jgi:hypothetical protein
MVILIAFLLFYLFHFAHLQEIFSPPLTHGHFHLPTIRERLRKLQPNEHNRFILT